MMLDVVGNNSEINDYRTSNSKKNNFKFISFVYLIFTFLSAFPVFQVHFILNKEINKPELRARYNF